jgi:hypothetical protein
VCYTVTVLLRWAGAGLVTVCMVWQLGSPPTTTAPRATYTHHSIPAPRFVQILSTMRKMLHDQEKEDVAKRAAKVAAGKRYQEELDQQLNELRTRSFNSLASKFSPFCVCCVLYSVAVLFDACVLFCADNLHAPLRGEL